MRHFKTFLSLMLLAAVGMVSCSDEYDVPPLNVPQAKHTANITISELKTKYWQDAVNYIDTIKEELYVAGRVISSDASGNIYKNMMIQDATGALAISINGTNLSNTYRVGQEVVISLKDLFIGKYNSLQQLGYPQYYENGQVWEATFLPLELFNSHVELNGLPEEAKVDTVVTTINQLSTTSAGLIQWQGQLVRFNNVKFTDADGVTTFSESDASTNRTIEDAGGNTIVVRNSNYANFKNELLPVGQGSVVGILSYYGSSASNGAWQILLRSIDDVIGFSTDYSGTKVKPYTVEKAIELTNSGVEGWVSGYVVGAVGPEVSSVSSGNDIEWKAPTTLNTSLVIADNADETSLSKCMIVPLPEGSAFRSYANLRDNPEVYKTAIKVRGTLATYMGQPGINNGGTVDEFVLSVATGGVTSLNEGFDSALPSDWTNVMVAGNKAWYQTTFDNNGYAAMTGYKGTAPFDSWLITPPLALNKITEKVLNFRTQVNGYGATTTKFQVYVLTSNDPSSAEMTELPVTLATAPASGYSAWENSGNIDLSSFDGTVYIGFRYSATSDANYATWCVDDVVVGTPSQGGDPVTPGAITATRGDFETFNNSTSSSYYGTYTSANGWTATNCNLLIGGTTESNPVFPNIGYVTGSTTEYAMAPCMNGKTTTVGSITSPVIAGGCGKLTFDYGFFYAESNGINFRVDIKQGGQVVKTFTVKKESTECTKGTKYSYEADVNVSGDFSIEFTNLCPTASISNKDRYAIWNVSWTNVN